MKKILIIDDDKDILQGLSILLSSEGYDVKTVDRWENWEEGLTSFQPNLVLLDVLLSGKDGREICESIKTKDETKKIPVIMVSAHPSADKSSKEKGADGFVAKPFDVHDLFTEVRRFI